jgi:hypothetical protein
VFSAAAVLIVAGGVAMATGAVPDSGDGEVHLCYWPTGAATVRGGTVVKVVDSERNSRGCASGERELVLNQTGPPGAPGASGISKAYATARSLSDTKNIGPASESVMKTLEVPAGIYVVTGEVKIRNASDTTRAFAACELTGPFSPDNRSTMHVLGPAGEVGSTDDIPFHVTVSSTSAITLTITCVNATGFGPSIWADEPYIQAIAVDSLG